MNHSYWDLKHEKHQWIWDYWNWNGFGWFQTIWRALDFCCFKVWGWSIAFVMFVKSSAGFNKRSPFEPKHGRLFWTLNFSPGKTQLSNLRICLGVLEISENQRQRDFQIFFVSRIFQIHLGLTYLQQLYINIDPNIWVCQKLANFETHPSTMQTKLKSNASNNQRSLKWVEYWSWSPTIYYVLSFGTRASCARHCWRMKCCASWG